MVLNTTTPLLVIGAALPRSGTASTKLALEKIGYKVFHALEWNSKYAEIWKGYVQADILTNDTNKRKEYLDEFVQLLSDDGFNATLDQPSCFVYKELMEYYTGAQVLLTQRDASSWARSMVEMAYSLDIIMHKPPFNRHPDSVDHPFGNWSKTKLGIRREEVYLNGVEESNNALEQKASVSLATAERAYKEYQASVLEYVPKERLLSFNVKDGWDPLCQNLLPPGQQCPSNEPFPRTNTAETSFLLDFRREAKIRTILYQIHPLLSGKGIGKMIYNIRYKKKWSAIASTLILGLAGVLFLL